MPFDLLPQPRRVTATGPAVAARPAVVTRDSRLPAQGYRLTVGSDTIAIAAADDAGERYAAATLAQLGRVEAGTLPQVEIEDWPDLPVRGVMLDVSRDKVPTVATLEALIERLAGWKVNQLQLYMEHTFAYAGHERVWSDASPFDRDEIVALDAFCAAHGIQLVPNQNCLGHMERWLQHAHYRSLAIAPDGWIDRRGRERDPTTLDPAKLGSLALVQDLLGQLLPAFRSARVHVGLDEPWELPDERFSEYVDWFGRLRALPELDGREMLVWGDIVARHPDQVGRVPKGVTVCEWGYEADHPFAARTSVLSSAGVPFWVCPGTSSWNTLVGRTTNARHNCLAAAEAGIAQGAGGLLVTDWGDNGHLQYLPVSEPLFAYAAAVGWCADTNRDLDLAAALGRNGFGDDTGSLAPSLLALGDAHRAVQPQVPNMSVLVMHLYYPQLVVGTGFTAGLTDDDLGAADEIVQQGADGVVRSSSTRPDAVLVRDEVATSAALLRLLIADARARLRGDGTLASISRPEREEFARRLDEIIDRHRDLWLARNRPGGLADSAGRLEHLRAVYLA